jgi:phage baseplate assembly protein gpV
MWGDRSTNILPSSVGGQGLWLYNTTESSTDLITANFFTDAFYIGMKQGDLIMGAATTGSSVSIYVGVIGAVTTAGGAIASSGGHLSSTR